MLTCYTDMYRQRAFIAMSACTTLATVTPLDGLQNMTPSSFYYNIYTTLLFYAALLSSPVSNNMIVD